MFNGDRKEGHWLLDRAERRLIKRLLPCVPAWIETYHLTLSTLLWCVLIVLLSWLARFNIHFLWGVSLMIVAQYITDALDGAVGRARNTGLIKWGFYMDHMLDYLFLCSIIAGYGLLFKDLGKYLLFYILALFGAFMVNTFLSFAVTNRFKISFLGIGPTEVRLLFILVNTAIILLHDCVDCSPLIPFLLAVPTIGLVVNIVQTQRQLWRKDMAARRAPPSSDQEASS